MRKVMFSVGTNTWKVIWGNDSTKIYKAIKLNYVGKGIVLYPLPHTNKMVSSLMGWEILI